MFAIEIENLSKHYGMKRAVDNLNLNIEEGELFALLGINGAGKTTTIKMLSCLIKPTSGDALLMGKSIVGDIDSVKKIISISLQESAVANNLTVEENLIFIAEIYGKTKQEAISAANDIMARLSLEAVAKTKAKVLSGGYLRRLSIAMAIITEPKILFLDEPTLGLDVIARRELWDVIKTLRENTTIILTTHYMEEAQTLADRIGIISNGKLKSVGTSEELKKTADAPTLEEAFIKLAREEFK